MSGMGEAVTMAASTKTLFRRGVAKRISGAATHLGKMITMSSRDRDRALSKLSYEVSDEIRSLDITTREVADELRALNCTLAAIALSDSHEGARLYLEQIAEEGIAAHHETEGQRARLTRFDETAGRATSRP